MEFQKFNGEGFTPEQINMLKAPMDASTIKHRPGAGGSQLAYIKGKTAIDQANAVFGFGQWGYKVLSRSFEKTTDPDGNVTSEFYTADVELYVIGAAFPFPGDGIGIVVPPRSGSPAEAHEKARKEAVTDALKRALRHYGSQFANDLYDEEAYVDAGNGVMVQVKEVKPNRPQQTGRRVIDASSTTSRQLPVAKPATPSAPIQPTSIINAPTPNHLRKQCEELFGANKWDEVLTRLFGKVPPDDNLTPEECGRIKRQFDIVVERRQAKQQQDQQSA